MVTKKEPKNDNREPFKLAKIFSNDDNTIYPIEADLQRKYCWPSNIVDKLFKEYIIDLFDENEKADLNGEDCFYGTIGDGILTRKNEDGKQEVIDMSQRITTIMAIVSIMIFLHLRNNGITDIEERRKWFYKYLRTKNKSSWKITSSFIDNDFDEVFNSLIDGSFKTDAKTIKSFIKCFTSKAKRHESVYKSFKSLCYYIYRLIEETIGLDDASMLERLNMFLNKTTIQVEICEKEERVKKFIEVNTNREGIAPKDVYKTLISANGTQKTEKFQEFEQKVKEITSTKANKRINILKSPISPTEYIMKIALIYLDETRETCRSTYSLSDERYGIEQQIKSGILDTEEKILKYLDVCIDICEFLKKSLEFKSEGFNEEWYLLTENHTTKVIWLYNILPCYVISKMTDNAKKDYAFEMLLKSFTVYSIKYSTNRSVQYIQSYMFSFAKEILEHGNDDCIFDDFKLHLDMLYNYTFGNFIKTELTKTVKKLDYSQSVSKSAIYGILSCFEYKAQKAYGKKRDNIYRLTMNDEIELDHIFPKSNENHENEAEIDSIGNLTFLEKSLNASKNDNNCLTSERYSDSSFISTKLMIQGNRYEGMSNDEIKNISENILPYTADKDTINNFEDEIVKRKNQIAIKIQEYLK